MQVAPFDVSRESVVVRAARALERRLQRAASATAAPPSHPLLQGDPPFDLRKVLMAQRGSSWPKGREAGGVA